MPPANATLSSSVALANKARRALLLLVFMAVDAEEELWLLLVLLLAILGVFGEGGLGWPMMTLFRISSISHSAYMVLICAVVACIGRLAYRFCILSIKFESVVAETGKQKQASLAEFELKQFCDS